MDDPHDKKTETLKLTGKQAVEYAIHVYESGDYPQAKAIFQEICQQTPDDHTSTHYLGLIAYQEKNIARALVSEICELRHSIVLDFC